MKLVRELNVERVRVDVNDCALASFEELAQAGDELRVAEPQSNPQSLSLYVPATRVGLPSPWNFGR
jgi:hypothetical protein